MVLSLTVYMQLDEERVKKKRVRKKKGKKIGGKCAAADDGKDDVVDHNAVEDLDVGVSKVKAGGGDHVGGGAIYSGTGSTIKTHGSSFTSNTAGVHHV